MPIWLNLIFKLKHGLIVFEKVMAAISLILLLSLAIFQLVARNFFDAGFAQMELLTRHLILFIIFMGAALISEQNRHIKIDVLTHFLSEKKQEQLIRPLIFFSGIISAVFAWYSVGFWLEELEYAPRNEMLGAYLAVILPIGFSILSLHLFLLTITGFEHLEDEKIKPLPHCSCSDIK